jgi:hypothetical protein
MPAFPQIRAQDARPDIAAIYSEIKIVSGLRIVNLSWRHFAGFPGILCRAWNTVSPIIGSTAMDGARQRIVASFALALMTANRFCFERAHVSE